MAHGAMALAVGAMGAPPPHIIHIMADDVGWNDLGYHQGSGVSPRIDALAMDGVRLTNHHAFKVCSPSRSAFHTGRLPWQMGMYDNSGSAVSDFIDVDSSKLVVPRNFSLLPQLLQKKGYDCHAIGKWHLGASLAAYTPTFRGYSTFLGYYHAMTEDYWAHTHSAADNCPGPGLGGLWPALANMTSGGAFDLSRDNGTYEATLFGDRAVSIIREHAATRAGRPLYLYLAFHNEHDPHQAPRAAIDRFERLVRSDTYKVTAAMVQTMDEQVGRVVDALNSSGMLAHSVIGFSSDNGTRLARRCSLPPLTSLTPPCTHPRPLQAARSTTRTTGRAAAASTRCSRAGCARRPSSGRPRCSPPPRAARASAA